MENLMTKMPKMLMGRELEKTMLSLPVYEPAICKADAGARLTALDAMTDIYVPSQMSYEIYSKVYLAMLHSLKKETYKECNTARKPEPQKIAGTGIQLCIRWCRQFLNYWAKWDW